MAKSEDIKKVEIWFKNHSKNLTLDAYNFWEFIHFEYDEINNHSRYFAHSKRHCTSKYYLGNVYKILV